MALSTPAVSQPAIGTATVFNRHAPGASRNPCQRLCPGRGGWHWCPVRCGSGPVGLFTVRWCWSRAPNPGHHRWPMVTSTPVSGKTVSGKARGSATTATLRCTMDLGSVALRTALARSGILTVRLVLRGFISPPRGFISPLLLSLSLSIAVYVLIPLSVLSYWSPSLTVLSIVPTGESPWQALCTRASSVEANGTAEAF